MLSEFIYSSDLKNHIYTCLINISKLMITDDLKYHCTCSSSCSPVLFSELCYSFTQLKILAIILDSSSSSPHFTQLITNLYCFYSSMSLKSSHCLLPSFSASSFAHPFFTLSQDQSCENANPSLFWRTLSLLSWLAGLSGSGRCHFYFLPVLMNRFPSHPGLWAFVPMAASFCHAMPLSGVTPLQLPHFGTDVNFEKTYPAPQILVRCSCLWVLTAPFTFSTRLAPESQCNCPFPCHLPIRPQTPRSTCPSWAHSAYIPVTQLRTWNLF